MLLRDLVQLTDPAENKPSWQKVTLLLVWGVRAAGLVVEEGWCKERGEKTPVAKSRARSIPLCPAASCCP